MAFDDLDRRILRNQIADELPKRGLLRGSSCVLGSLAVGSAADVGDADGSCVVAGDVSLDLVQRPPGRNFAVQMNDVVVADVAPAKLLVPATDGVDGVFLAFRCCRAVDGDGVSGRMSRSSISPCYCYVIT